MGTRWNDLTAAQQKTLDYLWKRYQQNKWACSYVDNRVAPKLLKLNLIRVQIAPVYQGLDMGDTYALTELGLATIEAR